MSTPNINSLNEGIVGQVANSLVNTANYISDTLQGNAAEAKKEVGQEQAKGNIPGKDSLSDRVSGVADAVSGAVNKNKYKGSAELKKQGI